MIVLINGKEISLSLQLDTFDVPKVSIISDTPKFLSVFFTSFGKSSIQIGFSLPPNRIIYLLFITECSTFADENNKKLNVEQFKEYDYEEDDDDPDCDADDDRSDERNEF